MLLHAKNHTLAIGDTRIDYVSFGKGDKCLVMIPGLSGSKERGFASCVYVPYFRQRVYGLYF